MNTRCMRDVGDAIDSLIPIAGAQQGHHACTHKHLGGDDRLHHLQCCSFYESCYSGQHVSHERVLLESEIILA